MKRLFTMGAIVLCGHIAGVSHAQASDNVDQAWVTQNLTSMPLAFTKNMGQWDERALFRADAGGATMWVTAEGVYYQFTRRIPGDDSLGGRQTPALDFDRGSPSAPDDVTLSLSKGDMLRRGFDMEPDSIETMVIKAAFVGANPNPTASGGNLMDYKCNYFLGNDPSKWRTDVPNYEAIVLEEVYPGIDLTYYGNGRQMEYDFMVSPGADYSQIQIQYEGAEELAVAGDGSLLVTTKWGEIKELSPVVYQEVGGSRRPVSSEYVIKSDNSFGFIFGDDYEPALAVVIDPVLVYSTYLGGSDDEWGNGIAVDGAGSAYVTGTTHSTDFPTANPFDGSFNDYSDAFVTKLSPAGNSLVYSTYLGGSRNDGGFGIALDEAGNAYLTGSTYSLDFPTQNPYDDSFHGDSFYIGDVFVTKLSPTGSSLVFSTYLGGSDEDGGNGIAVDEAGNAYVTGGTWSTDFPTANPFDGSFDGDDAFVTKLSPAGNTLVYSTYLGGSFGDGVCAIAVDGAGSAYVTGLTYSNDFPTQNPYDGSLGLSGEPFSVNDAFVTKFSPAGNSLVYSTYIGGSEGDFGYAIALDGAGSAYVTGYTNSSDFPTASPFDGSFNGSQDVFVTKLSPAGNSLVYSTFLGGGVAHGIAVDGAGSAYVTGSTYYSDFPIVDPFDGNLNGTSDAFVTKLSPAGNSLIFSTYLGGNDYDYGEGIAVDEAGSAYVTGYTWSSDFLILNPYDGSLSGTSDAFVTKFFDTPLPSLCELSSGLFCDDFETGASSLWTSLYGSQPGNCIWQVTNGSYGTTQTGADQLCIQSVLNYDWRDYVYEVDVRGSAGVDKEITFRSQDGLNTYDLNLIGDPINRIDLNKVVNGVSTNLANVPFSSFASAWYHITVSCVGATFSVSVNDTYVLEYTDNDNPFLAGGIGLVNWTGGAGICGVSFDNVNVIQVSHTPVGSNVEIHPADNITVSFETVSTAGFTTVTTGTTGGAAPDGFRIVPVGGPPLYYEIATDASVSGYINVCFTYNESEIAGPEEHLSLWHWDPSPEDITVYIDAEANLICGVTTSLSPFALAEEASCCVGRVGDANGSHEAPPEMEITLGDIMLLVDVKFISSDCSKLPCIAEADVNQDGGAAPNCEEHVTLGDIMTLVDFLFITGPENATLPACL